ncbi:MAG: alpha/beta hydrolase [Steroidobacteraceae bacterium]
MNPYFFGTSQRRLFGVHSPAVSRAGRSRAAVLCQPWGDDYIYAHRSMRQLAIRLSAAGFHALRFDYFGTGDSAGEEGDTDAAGSQADVVTAIETLKDLAATEKVTLIGLRAGANIAAGTAAGLATGAVDALILWDPILAGDRDRASAPRALPPLDVAALPARSLILVTQSPPPPEPSSRMEFLPAPSPWTESASASGVIPARVIQRIEEWLR